MSPPSRSADHGASAPRVSRRVMRNAMDVGERARRRRMYRRKANVSSGLELPWLTLYTWDGLTPANSATEATLGLTAFILRTRLHPHSPRCDIPAKERERTRMRNEKKKMKRNFGMPKIRRVMFSSDGNGMRKIRHKRTCCSGLKHTRRCPRGESGRRKRTISWQIGTTTLHSPSPR